LTFYSVAAGLSICLCLVLSIFAYFQPGTLIIRSWTLTIFVLSIGFTISGTSPTKPTWQTVILANSCLLSAGPILYSGFLAYCQKSTRFPDIWGWLVVLLMIPAFWYWGLIEPNGLYRSILFSLAAVATNLRTPILLARTARQQTGSAPVWAMTFLFSALVVWMAARFVILLFAAPPPHGIRGENPTEWLTVFGYILLMSLMTVCLMWMEVNRLKKNGPQESLRSGRFSGFFEYFGNKLLLLWSAVTVLIVTAISMLGIGYVSLREVEKSRLIHNVELVSDALVEHTIQMSGNADTILRAVRGYYLQTRSVKATKSFIDSLGFDRSLIDNIYLIGSDGQIIITHDTRSLARSVADREYFRFHLASSADQMFISEVEPGRVTGKPHFRITRRINNPDGSFGGLVLATVTPESFSRYYRTLTTRSVGYASLIGVLDKKLRARVPEPAAERWSEQVASPLWELLKQAPAGRYENTSQFDNIRRLFVYRKVGALPLVVVTGFTNDDLKVAVWERMSLLTLVLIAILLFTLLLALLLTIESKRRDEHELAEAALRKSEQRLLEAQLIGKIGDWEIDLNTGIVNYSDQIYEMSGRTPATMPLTFSGILLATHPDDAAELERRFLEGIANAAQSQMDARHILPDGSVKWFRYTGKPVCDGNGKVVKVSGTTQDIDRDKMMELELKNLNETLQQRVEIETEIRISSERLLLQRSKQADMGEMINAIAHQWRQPLTTVSVIFQNLLAARKMNKLDEKYLEKAATDATAMIGHMSRTIDAFRDYFKPEKSKEIFNAVDKIGDAVGFISSQLKAGGITIELPERTNTECVVNGFPNEFSQALLNLLVNARDAILERRKISTGADVITISAESIDSRTVIEVRDTGCGIPEEAAARIFKPYFTSKDKGEGTGIGLYISRQIIEENMGGKLTFTSKPGETIFRMELPNV
jgi:PAS domain S-box-containing protein